MLILSQLYNRLSKSILLLISNYISDNINKNYHRLKTNSIVILYNQYEIICTFDFKYINLYIIIIISFISLHIIYLYPISYIIYFKFAIYFVVPAKIITLSSSAGGINPYKFFLSTYPNPPNQPFSPYVNCKFINNFEFYTKYPNSSINTKSYDFLPNHNKDTPVSLS